MDAFDALLDGSLPVSQHPGRVFVGLVDDMTCLIGKTVFVLGMSDANFPATSRSDDLFSHLDEGLLGWVRSRENSPLESATCWLASVARYSDSLYLCHSSDEASHQVMPSVFLTDPQIFLPWLSIKPLQDELVEQCLDTFDWLIHHRSIPWSPETDIVEVLDLASLSRHVSAVTRLRESPDRITMWDGVLTDVKPEWSDVAKEVLNKALMHLKTDDQLKLSVSQLDSFAQSPLEYFFHRLLKLEPPTEYVDEAEMNRKGTLLHLILDLFYSDAVRYGDLIDPKRDPAAAFKRIASIAEDVFAEHPEDLGNPDTPFPAMLKRQILRTLEAFVQVEHDGLKQLADNVKAGVRPATLRGRDTTITEVPFEYRLDVDGEQVAVHGFIDRIDTNDDGSIQVIYDYKTGGDTSIKVFDEMNSGLSFQLPVYLNARKADGGSILAGYYHIQLSTAGKDIQLRGMLGDQLLTSVKPSGLNYKNNKGLLANDVLRQFLDLLQENRIKPIVRLIRSGRFHQSLTAPSEYSDYSRISRWSESVNELRKLALGRGAGDATSMLEHYYVSIPIIGGIDGASETSGED
jgi:ATP-dependent helicase/DNAse subunit B